VQAPRSRRGWLRSAELVEYRRVAGELTVDSDGGVTWMIITLGPKYYVRRIAERFAADRGFIVASVRRDGGGPLYNPLTSELNHVYVIRLERRQ
jgi:hypothetical protein